MVIGGRGAGAQLVEEYGKRRKNCKYTHST
jgi:hypothetical protein